MNVKEMDFALDMLSSAIIELETAFDNKPADFPGSQSVQRAMKNLRKAKDTIEVSNAKEWDRIIGG